MKIRMIEISSEIMFQDQDTGFYFLGIPEWNSGHLTNEKGIRHCQPRSAAEAVRFYEKASKNGAKTVYFYGDWA